MTKYIILSSTDNNKYLFYVPLVCWAWQTLGWQPVVFFHGDHKSELFEQAFRKTSLSIFWWPKDINGYKPETIAQCSRLYGACLGYDGYLMTSDADMLPLSNYWTPKENEITSYGRDLTDYHYPICYIGMPSEKWKEVMNIDGDDYQYYMQRDMRQQANMWCLDQDLITEKINASHFTPERIDRGTDKRTGYPLGRVDRSNWRLDHDLLIDAHLPHDILTNENSFKKVLELLHLNWPKENWVWFVDYFKEFKKLMK